MEQSATTAHTSNFATAHENGRSSLCIGVVGLGNMGAAFARNLLMQ
ncbi:MULTISPECIES: NAD(P)-binding domain-containing protein [Acetobacter]|nr:MULTISPECIES: NAD(P)-binding domain-containing protein [Acetobacter]